MQRKKKQARDEKLGQNTWILKDTTAASSFLLFSVSIMTKELRGTSERAVKLCNGSRHHLSAADVAKNKITWSCHFALRIFKATYEIHGEIFGIQALYVSHFNVWLQVWKKKKKQHLGCLWFWFIKELCTSDEWWLTLTPTHVYKGINRGMWCALVHVCRLDSKATYACASCSCLSGVLYVQVFLKGDLPVVIAEATDILPHQILQRFTVEKGFSVASNTLGSMQVLLIHILQKAEGKMKSRGPRLLLFPATEP